jgi:hypothetical protein
VDKLAMLEEHDRLLCELGVQRKMGPHEKPQVVMETVFAPTKATGPDGKTIAGWRPCRDPTMSLNRDTKDVEIAGYQLTDRTLEFSSPAEVRYMMRKDLPKAFHLTKIAEESLPLNAVRGVNAFYELRRGWFGWKGMPAVFHNATANLADGFVTNVKKVVDDILVHASTLRQFFDVSIQLCRRMKRRNIPIKLGDKLSIFPECTDFSGRMIHRNGYITLKQDSIDAMLHLKDPRTNASCARSLFGLAVWITRYVPAMSEYLAPFSEIIKKDYCIEDYDPVKQGEHFQRLKDHISKFVVCKRILNRKQAAVIAGDYSTISIASYLLQCVDPADQDFSQGFYIVELMSKILNPTQKRYSTTEGELLSHLMMINDKRNELIGMKIISFGDHMAWYWLFTTTEGLSRGPMRMIRWRMSVMWFHWLYVFVKGKFLDGPDIASRYPFVQTTLGTVTYPIGQPGAPGPNMRIGGTASPFSVSDPTKVATPTDARFIITSPLSAAALKVNYSAVTAKRNACEPFRVFVTGKKKKDAQLLTARKRLEEELTDEPASDGNDNEVVLFDESNFQEVSYDARATLPISIREEETKDPFIRVATCILKELPMPKDIDDFQVELCRKEFFAVKNGHYEIIGPQRQGYLVLREEGKWIPKRVVPKSMGRIYFNFFHSGLLAMHPGYEETLRLITATVCWYRHRDDIKLFCKTCRGCQLGKKYGTTVDFTLGRQLIGNYPFYKVYIDFHGPYPTTLRGNKYFWTCVEDWSKFLILKAVKEPTAVQHGLCLVHNVVLTYATPMIVATDNAAAFSGEITTVVNQTLGISAAIAPGYAPTFVAPVERVARTFLDKLNATGATKSDWDNFGPFLAYSENCRAKPERGNLNSWQLLFGRSVLSPYDAAALALLWKDIGQDPEEFNGASLEEVVRLATDTHNVASKAREASFHYAADRHASKPGKGPNQPRVVIGDLVAIRASPRKEAISSISKLDRPWYGPIRVTDVTEGGHIITGVFVPDPSITLIRAAYDVKLFFPDDDDVLNTTEVSTYIAESIIDARGDADNREYLIQWRGFPEEFNTWTLDEDVLDRDMVKKADRQWPPVERTKKAPARPKEISLLRPEEIEKLVDVRNARSGITVSFQLKGSNKETPYIPLLSLSAEVRSMPELQRALRKVQG